ncbi:Eukaryotic release factor 1 (eRF1) family protein isoform 1 [Hibiscus syriacus]|uniref:Eukaryotic release factor 1 (ERF1) family protein isoform 1 n=1 Tax=Hibiscus syriacus TaxID=106335 RepID=A0A6A2XBT9_HIBSY|nr:Eukaryotic release factor 1 (eRF1) family protein isoform 1 [Hibiscus syriacus]
MDDPESEWEIKESSSTDGKLRWVVRLGRKILVTGIVVSSAPLILPPIMAVSAIGLVCSVPYGVLLVSYACTRTLMSWLLPMPSPPAPLLLQYGKSFNGDDELIEDRIELIYKGHEALENGAENDGKESVQQADEIAEETGYDKDDLNERTSECFEEVKEMTGLEVEQPIIEESQNKQPAGIKALVEGDDKCANNIEKETLLGYENVDEKEELARDMGKDENVDAPRKRRKKTKSKRGSFERYRKEGTSFHPAEVKQGVEKEQVDSKLTMSEGDEGTSRRKHEQLLMEESLTEQPVDDKVIGARGNLKGRENDKETPLDVQNVPVQLFQAIDVEENEKLIGTTGEQSNEEEYVKDGSMSEQPMEEACKIVVEFEGDGKNDINMENETPFQMKMADIHVTQSTDIVEDEELVRESRGLLEKIRDGRNKSEEMDVEKRAQSMGSVCETAQDDSIAKWLTVESDTVVGGRQAEDVKPNYQLNKVNEDVVLSYENEREINEEQGVGLLGKASTDSLQDSPPEVNTEESWPSSTYSVHQEASDSSDLPVSTKAEGAEGIRVSAENAIDVASDEAIQHEENIWEQMNILRTIVGYKAEQKETCIEELKALYLFTGIEPPASLSNDSCDLGEVDVKLGFLKSVVGVK